MRIFRTFKIYDDNENHSLDFNEFYKGMRDYGIRINEKDARAAFDAVDRDKTGSLDFDEFLETLRVGYTLFLQPKILASNVQSAYSSGGTGI